MRFPAVILLAGIYLFSFTEIHEVLRLPYLLQHFLEHRHQNESVDFISFLLSHYGGTTHKGDHDHHNLPFDPAHRAHSIHATAVNIPELFEAQFEIYSSILSHQSEEPRPFLYTGFHLSIWQPPRG